MEDPDSPANNESIDDEGAETLELEQELYAVHDEAKRIRAELATLEKRKSQLQKKIAAWQKRYDAMSANKREAVRAEFEESVHWRTREIDLIQFQIEALEAQAAITRESADGVALHLEPHGINTSPRSRRRGGPHLSRRQREIRARARENRWGRRMHKLKARLKAERSRGAPAKADLEASAAAAEKELERIAGATSQAKARIKKRKRELSDWKQWYANLTDIDKSTEKSTLDREVAWRAREIQDLQTRLGTLEGENLNTMGRLEQTRIQMEALQAGAYDRPLDEDPRLTHVQFEREAAAVALARTRKFADQSRRKQSAQKSKKRKTRAAQRRKPAQKRGRKK